MPRKSDLQRLPMLLLSFLSEGPMHGYQLNQEIERRAVRQWAAVGLSSIYQALERLTNDGLLQAIEEPSEGQGPAYRMVYHITEAGRAFLLQSARDALASDEHQRFDYDLGVGVGITHLPLAEVCSLLEKRHERIAQQIKRVESAVEWNKVLGAWAVMEHQRRSLQAELGWLEAVIERLKSEIVNQK
jgi:DNA-binding PadR family transcriptional regulator